MLEIIIERLIALLGPIATLSTEKRELKDNALRAISTALMETKLYYRGIERGRDRNADTEAQLVSYWGAAVIPLRHIDEELAMLCERKSEYWLNPESWTDNDVRENGIKLEDVSKAYRQMAMPSMKVFRATSTANQRAQSGRRE